MGHSRKSAKLGLKCAATEVFSVSRSGMQGMQMKNLFLRSVMVVAIGLSTAAHAADMPVKAPITPPPIFGFALRATGPKMVEPCPENRPLNYR